jgi:DNA-binding IclR family transcriptional regulator
VDWTGRATPLHATAAGKIFLLHMPEEQRRRLLREPLPRYTQNTIVEPERLLEHIQEIRETGYAYTLEELEEGLNAVGAPIYASGGTVAGAVTVSGPAFRMPREAVPKIGELVKGAAAEISRCLGFKG